MEQQSEMKRMDGAAIRLDYRNMMAETLGEERGISDDDLDRLAETTPGIAERVEKKRTSGEWGFFELPYGTGAALEIQELAEEIRGRCDDFIVLGIGGSSLGGSALFRALGHPLHNMLDRGARHGAPRIYFPDNVDPRTFSDLLDFVDLERTVFNVVTKSGNTVETLSQSMIVYRMLADRLGEKAAAERIIVTTGATRERIRETGIESAYPLLDIPAGVGGRYSVLSPVGLFPAAVAGADITGLLSGARHMDGKCRTDRLRENPAFLGGALHYLSDTEKGKSVSVMMPYSDALVPFARWFRQLWAESLGKALSSTGKTVNSGQTPLDASGATDQHSLLQLFLEGPFDKLVTFLVVENQGVSVPIPYLNGQSEDTSYLSGHNLETLLDMEAEATQAALTGAGRSNMKITLPELNAFSLGQLIFMLELQTAFTGLLYDIDPMDQPGVEAIKNYIYGLAGRKGFQDYAESIRHTQKGGHRYSV